MTTRRLRPFESTEVRDPDIVAGRKFRFPNPSGVVSMEPIGSGPQLAPRIERAADSPFTRQIINPRFEKISSSRDFTTERYNLTLAAVIGATAVLPPFVMPNDQVGWIQEFRLFVLAQTATTNVTYNIRINQGPVAGFQRTNIPGVANLLAIISNEIRIRIPMGSSVDVLITNNVAQAETVGAHLSGWYHPLSDEIREWGDSGG